MTICYDSFLAGQHAEDEALAAEREAAVEAACQRIHGELKANFIRGLAGVDVSLPFVCKAPLFGASPSVRWQSFAQALHDVLDNMQVMAGHIAMMSAKMPDDVMKARDMFAAVAAERYADDHAQALAEHEIDSRRRP